jgi:hypothetical protein
MSESLICHIDRVSNQALTAYHKVTHHDPPGCPANLAVIDNVAFAQICASFKDGLLVHFLPPDQQKGMTAIYPVTLTISELERDAWLLAQPVPVKAIANYGPLKLPSCCLSLKYPLGRLQESPMERWIHQKRSTRFGSRL